MVTLKKKYSGEKGVYYYMFRKLKKIKNEFGCFFKIDETDFVTDLLAMGVTLKNFLDVLKPLSVQVQADERDGVPFGINPNVPNPKVYLSKKLELRWAIYYSEPKARYVEDKLRGRQFEPEFDSDYLEFDYLSFEFEDKELLETFLKEKIGLEEDSKSKEKTGVFDGIVYIKGKIFSSPKTPETEMRLKKIFKLKENHPINYLEIIQDDFLKDNSILKWKNRVNKTVFKGKEVIIKDGVKIHWTSENIT